MESKSNGPTLTLQPYDPAVFQRVWERVVPDQTLSPIALSPTPAAPQPAPASEAPPSQACELPTCLGSSSTPYCQLLEEQMDLVQTTLLTFRNLVRRTPAPVARPLTAMANGLAQDLRRLSAAYFLIAGVRYLPQKRALPLPKAYPLALRELYGQAQQRANVHLCAAQGVTDPCLNQLLTDLGDEAQVHSHRIRGILEGLTS